MALFGWHAVPSRCCALRRSLAALLGFCLTIGSAAAVPAPTAADPDRTSQTIDMLFGDEIRQAAAKVRWRGEPLSADTVYALALTGASWEVAWGKEHLFSLAANDSRKSGGHKGKSHGSRQPEQEVVESYHRHDYRNAVRVASANFSLDEISADPDLKEAVGASFMELGQPERAFSIFSAPYQPRAETRNARHPVLADLADSDRLFRESAFDAARRAGLEKEAIVFGLSLLLEPGTDTPGVHVGPLRYLEQSGVDVERVLLGVLEAPEHLRGLSAYTYAAADLLVLRASPHLLPTFVQMSESDDAYLRARALLALGIIAYQARPGDRNGWTDRIVRIAPREYGISVGQRNMIWQKVWDAANDGNYRLRAAAALALGFLGMDEGLPLLQKLAKDRAYILSPENAGARDHPQRMRFPVRAAAAAALARYGVEADPGGGEFEGRRLAEARRGGQDVTADRSHLRHDVASALLISPTDVLPPLEDSRR